MAVSLVSRTLLQTIAERFDRIGIALQGFPHYMNPKVRELIGYPGQENVTTGAMRLA
jgi:hypothetical protein